jgi:hypothetical protein
MEQFRAAIFNHAESHGQEKINKNHAEHAPIAGAVVATAARKKADEAIKKATTGLHESAHRISQLENEKNRFAPSCDESFRRFIPKLLIGLITLSEFYFIFEAARIGGFSFIPALLLAGGLAAGLGYLTHIAGGWIKGSANKPQLYKRILTTTVPVAILFYFLGQFRSTAYQEAAALDAELTQTTPVHTASAGGIAIASFILYCIGLIIAIRFAKTKEERAQQEAYNQTCQKLQEEKKNKRAKEEQIAAIEKESEEKVSTALATYEHALAREKQIQLICKKALEAYAASNLRHRTDGKCPPFFSQLPELQFTTLFNHAKTSQP